MLLASLSTGSSTIGLGVPDVFVAVSANGGLIRPHPIKIIALAGDIRIAHEMLQQPTAAEEAIEFAGADLHKIPMTSAANGGGRRGMTNR